MASRMWTIVLFTISVNLSIGVFSNPAVGLTPGGGSGTLNYTLTADAAMVAPINETQYAQTPAEANNPVSGLEGWVSAFTRAVTITRNTIFGLPAVLDAIGITSIITWPIYVLTGIAWAWLLIQLLRGINFGG